MARADAFRVEGVVVEVLRQWLCRVQLANGHRVLAFGKAKPGCQPPGMGDKIMLELSPYDLSKGRIIGVIKQQV